MSFEQRVVQLEETNAELVKEVVRVRDAAAGLNRIYPSVSEGRQAVGDGQYFVVPGEGTYQTLYRRSGSSAEPIAEFPSRAHLEDVIDQLGPLLGRGVEGGNGDLLAIGAFGVGSSPVVLEDANDAVPGSFSRSFTQNHKDSVANNWPDVGASDQEVVWWNLLTIGRGDRISQEATFCFGPRGDVRRGDKFVRVKQDDTWHEWHKVLTDAELGRSDTSWTTVSSPENGWQGSIRYIKRGGMVTVVGYDLNAEGADSDFAITLPSAYRPPHTIYFSGKIKDEIGEAFLGRVFPSGETSLRNRSGIGEGSFSVTYPVIP